MGIVDDVVEISSFGFVHVAIVFVFGSLSQGITNGLWVFRVLQK